MAQWFLLLKCIQHLSSSNSHSVYTINLPIEYHQQDKGNRTDGKYYCGPACAQMVLDQIGSGLLSQDNLYNDCHSHSRRDRTLNPPWETAPDGLCWTMNRRKPRSFARRFKLTVKDNVELISRKIAWTIHHHQVAAIALVHGCAHWIVIRGFDSDFAPSGPRDKSYTIGAFWINDPQPPGSERVPPNPPSPHSHGDLCGSGGQNYGEPNTHILYDRWAAQYMTGVPKGLWFQKFVAICDPDVTSEEDNDDEDEDNQDAEEDKLRAQSGKDEETQSSRERMMTSGLPEKIIDKKKAAEAAMQALKTYGLRDQSFLKEMLRDVRPAEPILVRHLGKPNEYYYIVPLVGKKKNIYSLVSIDGGTAKYGQASFARDLNHPIVFRPLNSEEIIDRVKSHVTLSKGKKVIISPYLVWKPCIESFSPNLPFYQVLIDNSPLYVRFDGQIFSELTEGPPGS